MERWWKRKACVRASASVPRTGWHSLSNVTPSLAMAAPHNNSFLPGAHLIGHLGDFCPPSSVLPAPPQWSDCVCRDDNLPLGKGMWFGDGVWRRQEIFHKMDSHTLVWSRQASATLGAADRPDQRSFTRPLNMHLYSISRGADPWNLGLGPDTQCKLPTSFNDRENEISTFSWEAMRLPRKGRDQLFRVHYILSFFSQITEHNKW